MQAIEPNWVSSLWFAGFAIVCTLAFLVVAGMFPLRARPEAARSSGATLLVGATAKIVGLRQVRRLAGVALLS